jgi:hypothetical protein
MAGCQEATTPPFACIFHGEPVHRDPDRGKVLLQQSLVAMQEDASMQTECTLEPMRCARLEGWDGVADFAGGATRRWCTNSLSEKACLRISRIWRLWKRAEGTSLVPGVVERLG